MSISIGIRPSIEFNIVMLCRDIVNTNKIDNKSVETLVSALYSIFTLFYTSLKLDPSLNYLLICMLFLE